MTVESIAASAARGRESSRRATPTRRRRAVGLTVLAAATAIGLSACGGGSHPPQVASLSTTTDSVTGIASGTTDSGPATGDSGSASSDSESVPSTSGSATSMAKGDPTRLLDEWATCMHSHGDPNQAAPTVDAYGVIHVTIPKGASATLSAEVHAGADPCNQYMAAAQAALRAANPAPPPPDQATLIKYVNCMRANGVPNYPYPTGNRTNFQGTGVDPNSPQVENVNKLCGQKLNLPGWWVSGNGPPGDVEVGGGPSGVNGAPPSGSQGANGLRPVPGNGGSGTGG